MFAIFWPHHILGHVTMFKVTRFFLWPFQLSWNNDALHINQIVLEGWEDAEILWKSRWDMLVFVQESISFSYFKFHENHPQNSGWFS